MIFNINYIEMPELPEVQTIVSDLRKRILGRIIVGVWTDTPSSIKSHSLKNFRREIFGSKIIEIKRRGKNFLFGKWEIKKIKNKEIPVYLGKGEIAGDFRNGFVRTIFYLDNGQMLGLS